MNDLSTSSGAGPVAALKSYLGPYENWNFGIGKPYAFPAFRRDDIRFLTALVEHPSPKKIEFLSNASGEAIGRKWFPTMWGKSENVPLKFWPIVFRKKPSEEGMSTEVNLGLQAALQTEGIEKTRFRLAFPVATPAMHNENGSHPCDPDWSPDPKVKDNCQPGKVINVLAVIDDGIPFAHRNFRAADGERTRIEFCWLQSANKETDLEDPSVLFGREYTRETIEKLIQDHGDDEDALYAEAGASSDLFELGTAINRQATHGAHVMDIAAGCDPNKSEFPAEETRLIAVQLPNTIAWDTSSFGKDMYMLSAVHYILERAERIAAGYDVENIRVAINFSYGFSGGRHDGASELEAAINEIVTERRKLGRPTGIVLPSGNTFMDRLHGQVSDRDFKDDEFSFTWAVQPNDRTSSYLEVWFPAEFNPNEFTVEVVAPFAKASASMELKPDEDYKDGDPRNFKVLRLGNQESGDPIGQISLDNHRTTDRWRVMVALAPSEPEEEDLPAAPAGDWKVTLKRHETAPENHSPIYLWIQRDADPEEFRSGSRQSYLRDIEYRSFNDEGGEAQEDNPDSHVRRFGTVNGLATGSATLIVSGCRPSARHGWDNEKPVASTYSSAGKAGSGAAAGKVDCTAPADRSNINPGIIGAGTRSGSYVMVQGTSVAAPLVARRLAEAFASRTEEEVKNAEASNYLSIINTVALPDLTDEEHARLGGHLVL